MIMATRYYTDASGLRALLAKIKAKFVDYALAEDLVQVQESLAETIDQLNAKVEGNTTQIGTKASLTQVGNIQRTVNGHSTQIENLQTQHQTDLETLQNAQNYIVEGINNVDEQLSQAKSNHADEMRRLAFHIGLPAYSVEQMMAWPNAAESWGKYKDNTKLSIWPRVDMSAVVNGGSLFQNATKLAKVFPMNTSAMTSAATMFLGCTALTEVDAVDLSSCADMRSMFYQCSQLESVGITAMKKDSTIQMRGMFQDCAKLRSVMLRCFDNHTDDADVMFYGCTALERVDIGDERMGGYLSVGKAKQMFAHCSNLTAVYDPIDVGECTDAALMFQGCPKLGSVKLLRIGASPSIQTWDFSELQYWGDADRNDDGGQSLLDTAEAACVPWNAVTLKFHATAKARLEEEGYIAELTSKGYTIA